MQQPLNSDIRRCSLLIAAASVATARTSVAQGQNAPGAARVRDYPVTLDELLDRLPDLG